MHRFLILLGISITFFFSFIIFSYLVHKDVFTQFDFDTTVRLQEHLPRRFDNIFTFFSDIGAFEPMLITLIIILLLRRKIISGLVTFGAFGAFHLIELFGKSYVHHLPPAEWMLRTTHGIPFPEFHVRAAFSYPSGHSGRAMFMSALVGTYVLLNKNLSSRSKVMIFLLLFIYDYTMLLSRVYLGEHWTTDVIGGVLLGIACGIIGVAISEGLTVFNHKAWGKWL